jgi:hypothetical protein
VRGGGGGTRGTGGTEVLGWHRGVRVAHLWLWEEHPFTRSFIDGTTYQFGITRIEQGKGLVHACTWIKRIVLPFNVLVRER